MAPCSAGGAAGPCACGRAVGASWGDAEGDAVSGDAVSGDGSAGYSPPADLPALLCGSVLGSGSLHQASSTVFFGVLRSGSVILGRGIVADVLICCCTHRLH